MPRERQHRQDDASVQLEGANSHEEGNRRSDDGDETARQQSLDPRG
jgi:hypothetical protein